MPAIADWPPVRTGARMRLQGKLVEKYDIGWTNGVTRMLLQ
ncbi:alpha,alpha-trehalase [Novilysobacter arseniciresistens]|nr:alpha,alpha-trehalase [Lysobacter arseniciresistens]